ncbi:hypothetical protein M2454_000788 [Aequitasia blattaphilus]
MKNEKILVIVETERKEIEKRYRYLSQYRKRVVGGKEKKR